MKLSRRQLRQIIKEELSRLDETDQFDEKETLVRYLQGILNQGNRYLKVGARDEDAVKALQSYVIFKLKDNEAVGSKGADGSFGGGTKTGVKRLQTAFKIKDDDGVVGPETAEVFLKDLGATPEARKKVSRSRSAPAPWNYVDPLKPTGYGNWYIQAERGKGKNKQYLFWKYHPDIIGNDPRGWDSYIILGAQLKPGARKPRVEGTLTKKGVAWARKKGYRTWGQWNSIQEFVKRGIVPDDLAKQWIAAVGTDSYDDVAAKLTASPEEE